MIVVDNYDSFVYNLVQYLQQLGVACEVRRNDEVTPEEAFDFDGILVSPGPGTPEDAGVSVAMVEYAVATGKPLLGVCLGHQALGAAFGATVSQAPELLHGKVSQVHHESQGVLGGLPSPFTATRYHSLAVERDTLPGEIEVTGETESGVVMAMRHRDLPLEGVQFHPESALTEHGHLLLANWLISCGDADAVRRARQLPPVLPTASAATG